MDPSFHGQPPTGWPQKAPHHDHRSINLLLHQWAQKKSREKIKKKKKKKSLD
jgi:hypothetical protein